MSDTIGFQATGNGSRIPVSTAQPMPVTLAPGGAANSTTNTIYVTETPRLINAVATAMVRPANTTAYVANDEISDSTNPISITVSDLNDAPVALTGGLLKTTDTGPGAFAIQIEVWVYNTNVAVGTDNAAFSAPAAGLVAKFTGNFFATSDGSAAELLPIKNFVPAAPISGGKTLKARVKTLTAFTPTANSTTFTLSLEGVQGRA